MIGQNYKSYLASKIMNNSIQDSVIGVLETRANLEKLSPGITMSDEFGKKFPISMDAYYKMSGLGFVQSTFDFDNGRVFLQVNWKKLNIYLLDGNDDFSSLDEALSIMAFGRPQEIMKSRELIETTIYNNKVAKRNAIVTSENYNESNEQLKAIANSFKTIDDNFKSIISSAHSYLTKDMVK